MEPGTSVTAALNKNRYIQSGLKPTECCLVTIKPLITVTTWIITMTVKLLTGFNPLPGTLHSIVERKLPVVTFSHQFSHMTLTFICCLLVSSGPTAPRKSCKNTNPRVSCCPQQQCWLIFRLWGKHVAEHVGIFLFSLFSSPLIKTLFSVCYAAGHY